MNSSVYRTAQIDFVSGHNGTSLIEIAFVVSSAPFGLFFRNVVIYNIVLLPRAKFVLDFITLVIPVLCAFTVLSENVSSLLVSLLAIPAMLTICIQSSSSAQGHKLYNDTKTYIQSLWIKPVLKKRPFIGAFRANVNLATAICILAVDFNIFPRRFCKAETYGTGLMDVGVGAFVIANAIVSPEARGKHSCNLSLWSKGITVVKALKSSSPLWLLGIVRLFAVKSTDYQEHVSEYGVHWNFFFTLATIKILSTLVLCMFDSKWSWVLALCTGIGYQYLLDGPVKLGHFALYGSSGTGLRDGLLNANREGLVSCMGYLAIYLAGIQLGKYLLKQRNVVGEWFKALMVLILVDVLFWICLYFCQNNIEPVSRRMANLSYVLWMMCYNLQLLVMFLIVDLIDVLCEVSLATKPRNSPGDTFCLLEAINYNGLLYFLLANVMTGAVNFVVPTLYVSTWAAFLIVFCYMLLLSGIISILYVKKCCFKCW